MAGNFLLDTNILSAWMAGDAGVAGKFSAESSLLAPSVSIGELYYGARLAAGAKQNLLLQQIADLLKLLPVIPVDAETASHFGLIKQQLKVDGKPIPENDVWIAALTRQHQLTLVTRDDHFNFVTGLQVAKW